jgi:glutathione S-transferase
MMLERKGIDYKRVDLLPVISKVALRLLGFPGITVPPLKIDGRKVQGSREIARELDRIRPEPPLLPADPERRAAVEQAEAWGEARE